MPTKCLPQQGGLPSRDRGREDTGCGAFQMACICHRTAKLDCGGGGGNEISRTLLPFSPCSNPAPTPALQGVRVARSRGSRNAPRWGILGRASLPLQIRLLSNKSHIDSPTLPLHPRPRWVGPFPLVLYQEAVGFVHGFLTLSNLPPLLLRIQRTVCGIQLQGRLAVTMVAWQHCPNFSQET